MIDLKNEVPFGLGDKVSHSEYGNGQIIGIDFGALAILFDNGAAKTFYDDGMPTEEATHKISELKYVGEWVSVNDALPKFDTTVLVHCGCDDVEPTFDYLTLDEDENPYFANHHDTITHWMYLPRLPDNKE